MVDREPNEEHRQEEMVPTMTDKDKEPVKRLRRVKRFHSFHGFDGDQRLIVESDWIDLFIS